MRKESHMSLKELEAEIKGLWAEEAERRLDELEGVSAPELKVL
jgi:hypothetical protein